MKKEDKLKLYLNICKFTFWFLLLSFAVLYISQATGYYEYDLHKKKVLTEEKIKQFEKDVIEGKNLNIDDYLEIKDNNYQNKISKTGYYLSSNIGKYVRLGITKTFQLINKFIEEE